jgi:membrane-bound serine protease (ClpP class)
MKRRLFLLIFLSVLAAGFIMPQPAVQAQEAGAVAIILSARGPLTPIMAEYIGRGLRQAQDVQAEVVIVRLDTPGGSIDLMNNIIEQIRASQIPVVVYVSPDGAMAGSAGTMITLAGHLAAMAPNTTVGAASPVGAQGEDIGQTMQAKVKEILKATVRTLTSDRPPAAVQLAESTIQDARAATVDEAVQAGLVDIKATDVNDLLRQLDGRKVRLGSGFKVLKTGAISTQTVPLNLLEEFLGLMANSNIVFLLLSIGVQAILIELSSPGGWVAGFIGSVCLLLAVYGLGILPVNWFGILFLLIAFVLFVLDIKAPTHGALTAAGAVSFVVGGLVLFNSVRVPGYAPVSVPLVVGTGIAFALSFFVIVTIAMRAFRLPVLTGKDAIIGRSGSVRRALDPKGQVQVAGELWSAELADETAPPVKVGAQVVVVAVEGLRLKVRAVED